MPSNSLSFFPFFLLMFVGRTTRSKFCLVSPVIDYKTQRLDGMDLLEIGPVNACEMALKNDEVENFSIGLRCYRTRKERKVLKLAERRKNSLQNRFQVEGNRRAHAQWHPDIRMPRLHVSKEHRDIRMIHLWNRFRTAPDSVAYCSG